MTTNARTIRSERYAEIGTIIQRDATVLIERWARRAVQEQPNAPRVHHDVLLDHLPRFLWELGTHLAESSDSENGSHWHPAVEHGEQRWETGWSLPEVVRDYRILRLVILEHLDDSLTRPLRLREIQAVGLALDEAIEASLVRYVRSRDEQLRVAEDSHSVEKKRAEEELHRWKKVFLDAGWGVIIGHPQDLTLLAVNPAFARMHGFASPEELVGQPAADLLAPEQRPSLREFLRPAFENSHHQYEALHTRKDGSTFPVLADVTVARDAQGQVLYWAGSYQDISDRRRLEESLRDQAEVLKEADRRKNEFLAVLAHELRNPLAPLRNALEVLRLNGDSAETLRQVRELMDRQVGQITRLVDDLLDVARIAQGKLVLRKERHDLRDILEQAVQTAAPLLQSRRHHFSATVPTEPLWVEGDPARLLQIVVNLLNNAAKYTPEGGRIEARLSCDGDALLLQVSDNGIGIPSERLAHVFDLFTQIDLGPDRTQGGLGIGLTLVRRLVELHGGSIAVRSPGVGLGSEFTVRLPRAPVGAASTSPPGSGVRAAHPRQVLIIEDYPDGRKSLAFLLRVLGHRVEMAEDGPSGIEAAVARRPEVILIDIEMPGMDGYEVARRVRSALGSSVVLVALTGHCLPEDRQRSREAGFDAHLAKPVDVAALESVLARKQQ